MLIKSTKCGRGGWGRKSPKILRTSFKCGPLRRVVGWRCKRKNRCCCTTPRPPIDMRSIDARFQFPMTNRRDNRHSLRCIMWFAWAEHAILKSRGRPRPVSHKLQKIEKIIKRRGWCSSTSAKIMMLQINITTVSPFTKLHLHIFGNAAANLRHSRLAIVQKYAIAAKLPWLREGINFTGGNWPLRTCSWNLSDLFTKFE